MKTIVVYYSYSGHTRAIAYKLATEESYDIVEIKDEARPGLFKALIKGCPYAMRGKAWPILPLSADLSQYDRLIMISPIWAGNAPPAFNAALEKLPEGKTIAVKLVSSSGKSKSKIKIENAIKAKKGVLESYDNIRG